MTNMIRGLIVPLITPLSNGSVDTESLGKLTEILSSKGVDLFPVSTTGEGPLLSPEDRLRVVRTVAERSDRVWAGTAGNSVEETVRLAREMLDLGAKGIVVVTPFYYPVSQEALYGYFSAILERLDAPVIAYTIPSHTCNRLMPETAEKLAEEYSNLAGIKVTTEDAGYLVSMIIALRGVDTKVLPGSVTLVPVARAYGVDSGVLAVGNLVPVTASAAFGDGLRSLESYPLLARVHYYLQRGSGPCTVKKVLKRVGVIRSSSCLGPLGYERVPDPPEWLVEEARRELLG